MNRSKLVFVGGFLGAGKTTLLRYLIRSCIVQGKAVGAIANDQADGLVDTRLLSKETDNIREVSGSCFCCNYDGLIDAIKDITQSGKKIDIIFAEPVGSCTDISATILQPLKDGLGIDVEMSPYTVLADATRLDQVLNSGEADLHPDTEYIYKKQLEEADVIAISKSDLISDEQLKAIIKKLSIVFPGRKIFSISAEAGDGVDEWLAYVLTTKSSGIRIPEIDYNIYGRGEAALGWINASLALYGNEVDWDLFLQKYFDNLTDMIKKLYAHIAHIKIMIESQTGKFVIGNITGNYEDVKLRGRAGVGDTAQMTINARVEATPRLLNKMVFDALMQTMGTGIIYETQQCRYFQPGFPKPVHRYQAVVNN